MTKIDPNLTYLIAENARIKLPELAQHLKKSQQRLKYSISMLLKEGIIRYPYGIVDYSYLGLLLFRVYFRGVYVSELDKQRIIMELKKNPYIVSIYELTGEFDLTLEFLAPNPSKFNKELKKLLHQIPTLKDYEIVLNVVTYICPKEYLVTNPTLKDLYKERIVGGDREREILSEKEMEILKDVLFHPTSRYTQLARRTKLNVKTAQTILRGLEKRNIIKGFRYVMDTQKLGIHKFRLFLRLHNVSPEREKELVDYVLKTNEVTLLNKTVGDWDMELDVEAFDKTRIRFLIRDLREKFQELMERFNLIEFDTYHKRTYLPEFLWEDQSGSLN